MTLAERIDELVTQHGSLRAMAQVMECSPSYICRLRAGVTANPGPAVLRKLGLRRVVVYEREPMSADWEHREFARAVEAAHGIKENT